MSTVTAPPNSRLEVALCDCCDQRPGTHMIIACGIETWVCDVCADGDREPEELPMHYNSAVNRDPLDWLSDDPTYGHELF